MFIQDNLFIKDVTAINKGSVKTKNFRVKGSNLQGIGSVKTAKDLISTRL